MKVAILDMGTNVFNLLIADVSGDNCSVIKVLKIPAKIGEGGLAKGLLMPAAFDSTREAFREIFKTTEEFGGVEEFKAFATSAVRGASNAQEYLSMIKNEFGTEVEIITGNREAELIYKGVRESIILYREKVLIMDIGGGSNELIIADKDKIYWKESYDLGVVRLKELFQPSDPIKQDEVDALTSHIEKNMTTFWEACRLHKPTLLIGCSGSFDTLRELLYTQDDGSLPAHELEMDRMKNLHQMLLKSVSRERAEMKGMSPIRVDYIVTGSVLINYIIERTGIKDIYQSSYSLKEGYMAEIAESLNDK